MYFTIKKKKKGKRQGKGLRMRNVEEGREGWKEGKGVVRL